MNTMIVVPDNASKNLAECVCSKEYTDSRKRTIIVGFPGVGLCGTIAAKYIIKALNLEVIGYIRSPLIPPVAVFMDGILAYPYRIYGDLKTDEHDIIVLIGESPAPPQAYYYLANAVLDWAEKYGNASEIICLDGFVDQSTDGEPKIYIVAEPDLRDKLEKMKFERPSTGYIGGLSGAILNESILREIDGYAFLVSTQGHYPDPIGAAKLIEVINNLKGVKIDTQPLIKDGERIKATMAEFANRTRQLAQEESAKDYKSSLYL